MSKGTLNSNDWAGFYHIHSTGHFYGSDGLILVFGHWEHAAKCQTSRFSSWCYFCPQHCTNKHLIIAYCFFCSRFPHPDTQVFLPTPHLPLILFCLVQFWSNVLFSLGVLMLKCYRTKTHIREESDTTLILSGNESVQPTSDKWKGAEMGGERSWYWGTYTSTFGPRVTLWPSGSLQQRKDCWRAAFVTITAHLRVFTLWGEN